MPLLPQKPGDALYERLITRNRNYQSSEQQDRNLYVEYAWEHFIGKERFVLAERLHK